MVRVGVHVSIAGGIASAVDRAAEKGCDVFQIFSRNPRGWRFKDLSPEEADSFAARLKKSGISPAFDHMPYLPNLASPKEDVYLQSVTTLTAELHRCGQLHIPYLVTHLGSHLGSGLEAGLKRLIDGISTAFSKTENDVMLLLENTAGTKNSMGSSFEDIASIMDALNTERLGVCLDTCHLFAAGYDIRTPEEIEHTLDEFENHIGLRRLKLIHLNDSKGELGSGLDRHEHIGLGKIGESAFRAILRNEKINALPLILETPIDSRRDDKGNIRITRMLATS
ncbi:MAG: deoxyribonuclease IV [Methanotrichaceae archaeon]